MDNAVKLTAAELSEKPVTIMPTVDQFYRMPQFIQDELMLFAIRPGVFEVPAYRYRAWLSALKTIRQKEE